MADDEKLINEEFINELVESYVLGGKSKLTIGLLKNIKKYSALGMLDVQIFRRCGIPRSTWRHWKKSSQLLAQDLKEGNKSIEGMTPFEHSLLAFLACTVLAQDAMLDKHFTNIVEAAEGIYGEKPQWRASAWILERLFSDQFAKTRQDKTRVTVNTSEDNKDVIVEISREQIEERKLEVREFF